MENALFRQKLAELDRSELLDIIAEQNPYLIPQIKKIERVFAEKLRHLTWDDGRVVDGRPVTNEELALMVDQPFSPDRDLGKMGLTIDQQQQLHFVRDPVLWARHYLNVEPRAYQVLMLRHPNTRKVLRAGRRLGKTFTMALILMHYSYTHNHGRCIVVAPMKSHVELIYEEILRLAGKGLEINKSIVQKIQSPQFKIAWSNGSTIRFFTSGIRCLTPDHDVMTRDGWKPIADVQPGEIVLSWRDGQLLWSRAAAVQSYDYNGPMLVHSGRQLSFRATPNHKWRVRSNNGTKYRWVDATELKSDQIIPGAGTSPEYETERFSGDELELWGWWISEGGGFMGRFARFSQKKQPGIDRIVELAERLGREYKIYQYGDKASEIRVDWRPPFDCGTNCFDKFLPRSLLHEKYRERLLEGLLGGDGWLRREGWEYSSSSAQLANNVQELAILLGLRTLLKQKNITYSPVAGGKPHDHWIVSAYPHEGWTVSRQKDRMYWEEYSGPVHCLTVPETGTFVVRHNGAVHVTGNSGGKADVVRGQEAHIIVLDELDYMHTDDLDSIYAMLQQTTEDQDEKILVGASTPTGRRERFWQWCRSSRFQQFWFPSYVNPFFDDDMEEEFREQYSEMAYRHEVEADWGEDAEGVYARRFVDRAFSSGQRVEEAVEGERLKELSSWDYVPTPTSARSFFVMGVDWDKYGAGTNIVVVEVCNQDHEDPRVRGRVRLCYREEVKKEEYTLTDAVQRIIRLNEIFQPRHIYVDRGFGEVQVELLHKYGVENPTTNLRTRVKGYQFAETIEMPDPYTKLPIKKELKPFMVDNLVQFLERDQIAFSASDEDLYEQLLAYVVMRTTVTGKPVFDSGSKGDHVHDALVLACFAITENYGDLMKSRYATRAFPVSNTFFLPLVDTDPETAEEVRAENRGAPLPIVQRRAMSVAMSRSGQFRPIRRKSI